MFDNDDLNFDPFATDFDFAETVQQPQAQKPVQPVRQVQQNQPVKQVQPVKQMNNPQAFANAQVVQSTQTQVVRPVAPVQSVQPAVDTAQGTTVFGSRTNRETVGRVETVASKRIEWKSSLKSFYYYDSEQKQLVTVDSSLEFIPLTATLSIRGTHQVGKKGTPSLHYNSIYSNEFTNYNSDYIVVNERDNYNGTTEVIAQGTYSKDIKPIISELPYANFTINVYCLVRGTDEIVQFMFSKSSRDIGYDISNNRMQGQCFKLDAYEEAGNAIKYNIPVLSFGRISLEEDSKATEIAKDVESKLAARNKSFLGNLTRQQPIQQTQQVVPVPQDQVDYYNSGYDDFNYMG